MSLRSSATTCPSSWRPSPSSSSSLCALTLRDARRVRFIVWGSLVSLASSFALHAVGPQADADGSRSYLAAHAWAYQATGMLSMALSWPDGCFSRLEWPPLASPSKEKHLLIVNGLAALLKLNHQTVRNWIDSGYLRAIRIGRRARTRRADFAAFSIASYTGNKSASERYPGWKRGRSGGSRAISLYRPPLAESCSLTGSRLGSRPNAGWAHRPERLKFPFSRSP